MSNNQTILVLVGLPGSGKSTGRILNTIKSIGEYDFCYSTDDKIEGYANEVGSTYNNVFQDYIKTATKLADAELVEAISNGQDVIWDQTNMSAKKRKKVLDRFPKNYRKECVCILPPFDQDQEDELKRRLDSRPGKTIPNYAMRNMRKSFQLPSTNEGFNHVHYFDIYGNMIDRNTAADLFGSG